MREPQHPTYSRPSGYFSSHANLFRSTQIRVTLYVSERRRKRSCVLFLFFFFLSFAFLFPLSLALFFLLLFSSFSFLFFCSWEKLNTCKSYWTWCLCDVNVCVCLLRKWPTVVTFIYKTNLERHRCRTQ